MEVALAAGSLKGNTEDNLKRAVSAVVVGEGVAVKAGSAGLTAASSKAAADSETVAAQKILRNLLDKNVVL